MAYIALEDLPEKYQRQAVAQMRAQEERKRKAVRTGAVNQAAGALPPDAPQSEVDYYTAFILPHLHDGTIRALWPRRSFPLLPEKEFCGMKLPAAHYTPDFIVEWADGRVEVVEVKSKFTRRAQRDYIYRRRLFIDLVAEPNGWTFTEYIAPDKKEGGTTI